MIISNELLNKIEKSREPLTKIAELYKNSSSKEERKIWLEQIGFILFPLIDETMELNYENIKDHMEKQFENFATIDDINWK